MKILVHTRTADDFDWERRTIELYRLPCVGEYIATPANDGGSSYHEIRAVIHIADPSRVAEAEVFCSKVGPIQLNRLGSKATTKRDDEESNQLLRPAPPPLLTLTQAAKLTNVSEKTIRRLIQSGRLKAVSLGTSKRPNWRVTPEALAEIDASPEPVRSLRRVRRSRVHDGSLMSIFPSANGFESAQPRDKRRKTR